MACLHSANKYERSKPGVTERRNNENEALYIAVKLARLILRNLPNGKVKSAVVSNGGSREVGNTMSKSHTEGAFIVTHAKATSVSYCVKWRQGHRSRCRATCS